jgi:hypothetical protein
VGEPVRVAVVDDHAIVRDGLALSAAGAQRRLLDLHQASTTGRAEAVIKAREAGFGRG